MNRDNRDYTVIAESNDGDQTPEDKAYVLKNMLERDKHIIVGAFPGFRGTAIRLEDIFDKRVLELVKVILLWALNNRAIDQSEAPEAREKLRKEGQRSLYDNVKAICEERNLPISTLEDSLGFPRSYICKWNKNEPGIRKVQKVADYLGVPIEKLLE